MNAPTIAMVEPANPADEQLPGAAAEVVEKPSEQRALTSLGPIEKINAGLEAFRLKYEGKTFDMKVPAQAKAAREARAECVEIRANVDEAYEIVNRPLLETGKAARALRDAIKAKVKEIEGPIDDLIKADEKRKAEEKAAREEAERQRVNGHRARIHGFTTVLVSAIGLNSTALRAKIDELSAVVISKETFDEYEGEARGTRDEVLAKLQTMHDAAFAQEQEAAKVAAERERLALEQRERDEKEALERRQREEALRLEAEQRAAAAAREAAGRKRIDALRSVVRSARGKTSAEIQTIYTEFAAAIPVFGDYLTPELLEEATTVWEEACFDLRDMREAAQRAEEQAAEAKRLAAEKEAQAAEARRLAEERAQLEAHQRAPVVEAVATPPLPPEEEQAAPEVAASTPDADAPAASTAEVAPPSEAQAGPVASAPIPTAAECKDIALEGVEDLLCHLGHVLLHAGWDVTDISCGLSLVRIARNGQDRMTDAGPADMPDLLAALKQSINTPLPV